MRIARYAGINDITHYMRVGDLVVFSGLLSKSPKRAGLVTKLDPIKITRGKKCEIEFSKAVKWKLWRSICLYHLSSKYDGQIDTTRPEYKQWFLNDKHEHKNCSDTELIFYFLKANSIDIPEGLSIEGILNLPIFRNIYFRAKK